MLPPAMSNKEFSNFLRTMLRQSAAKKIIVVGEEAKATITHPDQIPEDTSKIIGYVLPPTENEMEEYEDTRHFAFARNFVPKVNILCYSLGEAVNKLRKEYREAQCDQSTF